MKIKNVAFYIICLVFPILCFGQIKLTELVQSSEIATQSSNSLYFVDFWATWCGPCVHASKYLSVLQKQYPDNFYIISLSQENPETVKRFLKKHKTDLAVAIDFEGETFKKFNIRSLPRGVLLNGHGQVLWEGHPADLKSYQLTKFLKQNTKLVKFKTLFEVHNLEESVPEIVYHPNKDFECFEITYDHSSQLEVIHKDSYLEVKGTLQDILAYAYEVYRDQIVIDQSLNKKYHLYFKKEGDAFKNMFKTISEAFNLNVNSNVLKGDAIVLSIKNPRFWGTDQINWGRDSAKYLIGDSQLQADNVTLGALKYKLALLLEIPVITESVYKDNQEHDWQIHYKYFDLMKADLIDNYGIGVEKKISKYFQYTFTKKEL